MKGVPTTGWGFLVRKSFLQPIIPDILIRLLPEQNLGYQLWACNGIIPTNISVFPDPLDSHSVFLFTVPRLLNDFIPVFLPVWRMFLKVVLS